LSPAVEFLIVILGAFGLFIFESLVQAFFPDPSGVVSYAEVGVRQTLTYELIAFVVLLSFLYLRGWTMKRAGFDPGFYETIEGLGLGFVYYLAYIALWSVVTTMAPQVMQAAPRFSSSGLGLAGIIAASILNPLFEETFVCGYVVSSLKDRVGVWNAVNVSAAIRLLYHLYQGVAGVVGIVPMGLIFAHWYARRGNLWPLIVAHAWLDLYALVFANLR
jgi:membrane protease YdiL (CAAX protease family)